MGLGSAVAGTVKRRQWLCHLAMKGARVDCREVEVISPLGYDFFIQNLIGYFFIIGYLVYSNLIFIFQILVL